jgi:hypothetical protein
MDGLLDGVYAPQYFKFLLATDSISSAFDD